MKNRLTIVSTVTGLFTLCAAATAIPALASYPTDTLPPEHVAGAFPAPPKGPGPGRLTEWRVGSNNLTAGNFGTPHTLSGNSFFVAYDANRHVIYVPTEAGKTFVLGQKSLKPIGHFESIAGGRIARVTPNHKLVLILSGKALAAYSTANWKHRFTVPVGGNALAVTLNSRHAFIGGNMSPAITEINLQSGKVEKTYPVNGSGDLAWANGKLFSANMKSGVMSIVYPQTGKVVNIPTPEVDPNFSYKHILAAKAGMMQLAVSPDQRVVYAAGFSGQILLFSTHYDSYLGEIPVKANPNGPNKLSGLTVINGGADALVTVENLKEAVHVHLLNGQIVKRFPGIASNRWITFPWRPL